MCSTIRRCSSRNISLSIDCNHSNCVMIFAVEFKWMTKVYIVSGDWFVWTTRFFCIWYDILQNIFPNIIFDSLFQFSLQHLIPSKNSVDIYFVSIFANSHAIDWLSVIRFWSPFSVQIRWLVRQQEMSAVCFRVRVEQQQSHLWYYAWLPQRQHSLMFWRNFQSLKLLVDWWSICDSISYPSMINASSVVSPFSSGLPPKPTVPSHCSRSHTEQPSTMASMAVFSFDRITSSPE